MAMVRAIRAAAFVAQAAAFGDICREADHDEGNCMTDGSGCTGEQVEFQAHTLQVDRWNPQTQQQEREGQLQSYAIVGKEDTWQMYLHGPMLRPSERTGSTGIPPVYVSGTWVSTIYRFENFSIPDGNKTLTATQKVVGHALAPSTTWPVEEKGTGRLKGLLVAEGQPWWLDKAPVPAEIYKGGVEFLPSGQKKKCSQIFPETGLHRIFGQVVNTVDCHKGTGLCFFTVWKFYDDQKPIWSNFSEKVAPDCLYYCLADQLDDRPSCKQAGVVTNEHGEKVCHRDGRGAVHGMTIGNDDPSDPTKFDIFLVFTGGATFIGGDSSMQKVKVQVTQTGPNAADKKMQVVKSEPFAEDLFSTLPPKGMDAGGDHAWVDETGKWIWISTFREAAAGVHMVSYEQGGKLVYSISGIDNYLPNQYAYSAGIHGVGTAGQPGSYLAVATSACHDLKACAPIPWIFPVPKSMWAAGIFYILDLSSLKKAEELESLDADAAFLV